MSRNVRQNHPPARRIKVIKRRVSDTSDDDSSSLNLSDDTGYSAVEDVSDSDEDDEEHVVAVEAAHILKEARKKLPVPAPRPLDDENDADEENDGDDDIGDDEDDEEEEDADDDDEQDVSDDSGASSTTWRGLSPSPTKPTSEDELVIPSIDYLNAEEEMYTPHVQRHVRFKDLPPSSDSDATSTDSDASTKGFFPDIFVDQNSLDPTFRREIERDDGFGSDSSSSFWDYQNYDGAEDSEHDMGPYCDEWGMPIVESTPLVNITPKPSPPRDIPAVLLEEDKAEELDGYETDGDTTEEDIPEPLPRKKQMIRRPLSVETSDSETPRPIRHVRGKPRVAQFNLDRTDNKPIGVIDPKSGKMIIFTPRRMHGLAPETFNFDLLQPDYSNEAIYANAALFLNNMMPFGDFINTEQPSAFETMNFVNNSDVLTAEETDYSTNECNPFEESEGEDVLRLEDLLELSGMSSDEAEQEQGWDADGMDFNSSPARPKTSASAASFGTDASAAANVHPLLNHFGYNPEAVGAFRMNQVNQQLINSEVATQDSLAFSNPYTYGTLKGIKSGSLDAVTTPITPVRRQKRTNSLVGPIGFPEFTPGSPLNSASQKRKFTGNHGDADVHKRHRSITDIEGITL
ncbi:hypothetical protein QBC35DRAFT_478212 [Podospora australis]|uniref:Uncharacterized protein n=1 Tax=Podospora australis TaxID=1536484 RepID=A0AAN6WK98_9PEZI|nr:hypothetical protein QBC35DRAFT_478212 [Podospora australis]